jgi:hypothetical protein
MREDTNSLTNLGQILLHETFEGSKTGAVEPF